jgi:uncharacterized protein YndB with AHSA1/START domain
MNQTLIRIFFGLVALSALLFAGFFAIGQFTPKVEVSTQVRIDRPVAEVFAAFNDPFDRMDWLEGYEGTERVSGGPGIPGSVTTVFLSHNGKQFEMREELKAYTENELVEVLLTNEMFAQQMRVEFTAVDTAATEVTMTGRVEGASWFTRSMMALARERMQAQEGMNFVRFKEFMEQ